MAGPEVVGFQLSVDMKGLTAQLASIPGITKASATAMVKELRDSYREAAKNSKSLADNVKRDMEVVKTSTGAAKAGALNLGNQLSDIAIQLESGTPIGRIMLQQGTQVADALAMMGFGFTRLLAVIAPVGLAIGALALVYSDLVEEQDRAKKSMAAAAAEATTLADALGRVKSAQNKLNDELALAEGTVTEAQLAQRDAVEAITKEYAPLIAAREENIEKLKQELATEIGPAQERARVLGYTLKLKGEQKELADRVAAATARETAELDNLRMGQGLAINAAVQTIAATERAAEAAELLRKAEEELRKEIARRRKEIEADFRTQQTLADIDQQRVEGIKELMSIESQAETAMLDDAGKVTAALETQVAAIRARTAALVDSARSAEEGTLMGELGLRAEVAATAAAMAQIREIRAKEDKARDDEAKREKQRQQEIVQATFDAAARGMDIIGEALDGFYDARAAVVAKLEDQLARSEEYLTDSQREELEQRIEAQRTAARRAFEIAKAARIAGAIVSTYAAANEALVTGGPFPANIIAAAAVTTAGLINVAQIASQQPAFHRGGMVDEVPINALRGEAVLSRQGRAMIGDETINRANAGASSGGSGATVVYQVYDRRILDRVTMATIKAGGKLDGYLRTQRSAPYGHRS